MIYTNFIGVILIVLLNYKPGPVETQRVSVDSEFAFDNSSNVDADGIIEMKVKCIEFNQKELMNILGFSYNTRYMSIQRPREIKEPEFMAEGISSGYVKDEPEDENSTFRIPSFDVPPDYKQLINPAVGAIQTPDWEYDYTRFETLGKPDEDQNSEKRVKRSVKLPWDCEEQIMWTDLGQNYFPRYIRSRECTSKKCFNGQFKCKQKSFTVRVLKRWTDSCKYYRKASESEKDAREKLEQFYERRKVSGVPQNLLEVWDWEERAVGFCCQCTM